MTLFGLWHGAKATFILWGIYEGALLVTHRMVQQFRRNRSVNLPVPLDGALSWPVTFLAVSLGWIFFRSRDLGQPMNMLGSTLSPGSYLHPMLPASYFFLFSAVLIAYIAHKTILAPALVRLKEAATPGGESAAGRVRAYGTVRDRCFVNPSDLHLVSFNPAQRQRKRDSIRVCTILSSLSLKAS
jgi:hypothetical protein